MATTNYGFTKLAGTAGRGGPLNTNVAAAYLGFAAEL